MSAEREFEGKTLEEAIAAAAAYLGADESAVVYRLLDEGRLGVFGLGARPVRIAVEARPEPAAPPRRAPKPEPLPPPEPRPVPGPARADNPPPALVESVGAILRHGGFDMEPRYEAGDAGWRILLEGPDRDLFLRKDGELLGALEFVLHRMGRRGWPGSGPLSVECDGRRGGGRDEEVAELAREVASVVARTGKARRLQPMNPYERRIVHVTVREFRGLVSRSEGQGFLKRVTIERGRKRAPRRDA